MNMLRSIVRGLTVGALAASVGVGSAASALADETTTWVPPVVSWDGSPGTWTDQPTEPMFRTDRMVPCDTESARVFVKNGGTRAAHLTIELRDVSLPKDKQEIIDAVAALPSGTSPSTAQLAVTQLYEEVKLRTDVGAKSVNDFMPHLVGKTVTLFDGVVEAGEQAPVDAWYDWKYGNACEGVSHAGNGQSGPWMDFVVSAQMYYVDPEPTDPTDPTTPPPSSSTTPPTSTTAPSTPIEVGGKSTTRAPGDPGNPGNPGNPGAGGQLPSTGVSGPLLGLGLSALVLIAVGLPLVLRRRNRRTHA